MDKLIDFLNGLAVKYSFVKEDVEALDEILNEMNGGASAEDSEEFADDYAGDVEDGEE